ncbi:conserved unknown protein [Ectocarpus siliculosus]|uniref:Kinesin light chain n=1 Tax=Ectocarpus siliculosus TaxID=2880 RepID=D7FWM6_ECTSI|nr:conserved unknown protein [Ectocarpus siliculosus]|eukprot:CBJ32114.1 conserved unknown protein [Ectocarpus siliculosus]
MPEKVLGPEHPDVATVLEIRALLLPNQVWLGLNVLAMACSTTESQGKYEEAEPLYDRSQATPEKVLGPEHPDVATVLKNKRYCWLIRWCKTERQGKYEEAEPLYERSQATPEKVLGPEHPDVATVLKNKRCCWLIRCKTESQGKYEEAEPLYERSQAITEKVLGPEHPDVATVLENRALIVG